MSAPQCAATGCRNAGFALYELADRTPPVPLCAAHAPPAGARTAVHALDKRAVVVIEVAAVDTINVTALGGPPAIALGRWVRVTATDGATTITRRVPLEQAPRVGHTFHVSDDLTGGAS